MLTVELVAHMDAGARRGWRGEQDLRPLSELGTRQAQHFCATVRSHRIDALFSSPALRCQQTLQPLADALGVSITDLPELRETDGFAPPSGWAGHMLPSDDPVGGAYAAGRASSALQEIRRALPEGRAVLCTHGDVLPAYVAFLSAAHGIEPPPLPAQRGYWYTLEIQPDSRIATRLNSPLADFPL